MEPHEVTLLSVMNKARGIVKGADAIMPKIRVNFRRTSLVGGFLTDFAYQRFITSVEIAAAAMQLAAEASLNMAIRAIVMRIDRSAATTGNLIMALHTNVGLKPRRYGVGLKDWLGFALGRSPQSQNLAQTLPQQPESLKLGNHGRLAKPEPKPKAHSARFIFKRSIARIANKLANSAPTELRRTRR